VNLVRIQIQFGGQFLDARRSVECLEDLESTVVSVRQLPDAVLDRCGHAVPLLEISQGLVREGDELIVAESVDLDLKFVFDDVVVEAGVPSAVAPTRIS
jgi:hypothetical protein